MIDNCDMNIFDPEKMEIKPGNIDLFIPVGSNMTASASVDSVYCISLRASDRDVELKMSREQAIKLARGILTVSGEDLNNDEKYLRGYDDGYQDAKREMKGGTP